MGGEGEGGGELLRIFKNGWMINIYITKLTNACNVTGNARVTGCVEEASLLDWRRRGGG